MKSKKAMKKQTKVVLVATGVFLVGAFVVSYLGATSSQPSKGTPTTYLIKDSSQASSSGDFTTNSSSTASSPQALTDEQVVSQFIKNYFTQPLNTKELDKRSTTLKNDCTDSVYQTLGIDNATEQLKVMLIVYQKKQSVNTNSSVRFVNRAVQNVTLYKDTADGSRYYAEVQYNESTIAKSGDFVFSQSLKVAVSNGQISEVKLFPATPNDGGKS